MSRLFGRDASPKTIEEAISQRVASLYEMAEYGSGASRAKMRIRANEAEEILGLVRRWNAEHTDDSALKLREGIAA